MTEIKITQKRNNSTEIVISGDFTIYSAMDVYQEHLQKIKLKDLVIFKLVKIEEIDTAGVQLLVLLFQTIVQQGAHYHIESISDSLVDYCDLFNLAHYFSCQAPALKEDE